MDRLNFINENGEEVNAEIIFQTDLNGRDYIIYALDKDADNVDLLAARVVKNEDGTERYDKQQLNAVIQSLLEE